MMERITKLKIAEKLPAIIVGCAIVMALGIGLSSYWRAASSLHQATNNRFEAALSARQVSFSNYLTTIEQDLDIMSTNPLVASALAGFERAWGALQDENPTTYLQRAYISGNSNAAGEKHLLDYANDGSQYSSVHRKYHPWIRTFLNERGYYDIFLFDMKGNVIYSVFKELDYATNVLSGEWKESDLGTVFKTVSNAPDNASIAFTDFKPYAPSADAPASFIARPVLNSDGVRIGVIAFQMPVGIINQFMASADGLGETGEMLLIGTDGLMRADSRLSETSTLLKTTVENDSTAAIFGGADRAASSGSLSHMGHEVRTYGQAVDFHGVRWAILAQIAEDEVNADLVSMRNTMLVIAIALVAAISAAGYYLARQISGPISATTDAMTKLASGNTQLDLEGMDRHDEIGDMARAVEVFRQNAIQRMELEAAQAEEQKTKERRTADIEALIKGFDDNMKQMLATVSAAAEEMEHTASAMNNTAATTNAQSAAVAAASEEASANVQTVAGAAEELSSSIQEIRRQVTQSTQITQKATNTANDANSRIEGLSEAARQISEVVTLIQDVAEQTNLLALNATIEAARAGEAGKGFAVVASEVKELANQTARATEQISKQIAAVQSSTDDAVTAIRDVTITVAEISEISQAIAVSVDQQQEATVEISTNVQQAAASSGEVASNISGVTASANESASAATQVQSAAAELASQADHVKIAVDEFLKKVRAA
ncbi:MAG: methyl-accepting chemotaxis protein [Parvibaculum sp.]